MISRMGFRRLTMCLVASLAIATSASAQDLPRGQIVDDVKCLDDASQGYALYLPSTYAPDKAWPLLLGFHPGARGRAIVEKYRAAAEQYGYIVAASNNSRNGPWEVSQRAVVAMARDLGQRFSTDQKRLYATGHSGGARVAMQLALTNPIAGVIASSAGYPDSKPRSRVPFVIFGTAGDTDFNYIEMKMLEQPLKSPHRIVIFEGGHTLPPDDVAMEAIEWLELQAMRSGARPKDATLLSRLWERRLSAITAASESTKKVVLLQQLVEDFKDLRDVKAEADEAAHLLKDPATRKALAHQRDADAAEIRTLDAFATEEAGLRDADRRSESLRELRRLLDDCRKKATSPTDSPERDSARRLLRVITMGAAERVSDADYLALLQKFR